MVNEVAIGTPFWLKVDKKNEWAKIFIDWINETLKIDPERRLSAFAVDVNKVFAQISFEMIKEIVDAQFDKE